MLFSLPKKFGNYFVTLALAVTSVFVSSSGLDVLVKVF